jgi:RNA polymerase sigma-70 factor (ECF subfamily)
MAATMPESSANSSQPDDGPAAASDDFVTVLLRHQRQIYAFIATLLPHQIELDDVYQQTCLVLWQKRDQFDPSRPFLPWAYAFARNEAFSHLRREGRGPSLSTALLERIAAAREEADATATARRAALEECVKKLPDSHRSLIQSRYAGEVSLKNLAAATATTAAALTMRLQRIRHALLRCVEQTLADGGGS